MSNPKYSKRFSPKVGSRTSISEKGHTPNRLEVARNPPSFPGISPLRSLRNSVETLFLRLGRLADTEVMKRVVVPLAIGRKP